MFGGELPMHPLKDLVMIGRIMRVFLTLWPEIYPSLVNLPGSFPEEDILARVSRTMRKLGSV